jgi:hypothetical protein
MRQEQLISKLIDLEDKANAHASEYLKLLGVPGNKAQASQHYRKALRLRARVQGLIRQIGLLSGARTEGVFSEKTNQDRISDFGL